MTLTNTGARTFHDNIGTSAETWGFSEKSRRVRIRNKHASQAVYATVNTSRRSSALQEAGIVAAVAAADETIYIPPGGLAVEVFNSNSPVYVGGSIISVGGASDCDFEADA